MCWRTITTGYCGHPVPKKDKWTDCDARKELAKHMQYRYGYDGEPGTCAKSIDDGVKTRRFCHSDECCAVVSNADLTKIEEDLAILKAELTIIAADVEASPISDQLKDDLKRAQGRVTSKKGAWSRKDNDHNSCRYKRLQWQAS